MISPITHFRLLAQNVQKDLCSHPPRAAQAALAQWYAEPLSEARTPMEDFFSIISC